MRGAALVRIKWDRREEVLCKLSGPQHGPGKWPVLQVLRLPRGTAGTARLFPALSHSLPSSSDGCQGPEEIESSSL